jgi:capsular exopolysaccharide synthesis family protein
VEAPETKFAETDRNPIDLMKYLRIVIRRRWLILAGFSVVVLACSAYVLRSPKIYQSTASIIIDNSAPRYLDNNQVQEVMESGTGQYWYNKEHYETQYKVIVSRAVSKRVVEKLGLQNDVSFLGLVKLKDPIALKEAQARLDAIALLQNKIRVQPVKESKVVYINVEDLDPDRAALLANEITQAYIAENLALKLRTTETASEWLEARLKDLEQKSHQSEVDVYNFKKEADMLTTSLEDRQSMVSQRLNATNVALTEVRTRLAGLRARAEAINKLRAGATGEDVHWAEGLSAAADNLLVHQLKVRFATQKDECAELKERYLLDHPKLVACMEKLASTRQGLAHELGNVVKAAETDLLEGVAKERNLTGQLEEAKAEGFAVNKKQIEFDRLKRETDNNHRLYDLVLKRLKDIELSGLLRTSNVRILDPARTNILPVRPNVRMWALLAIVLGLLSGLTLAFAAEFVNNTVTSQSEIEEQLGLPFLGMLPRISEGPADSPLLRDLHIYREPKSHLAECCRAIRTNLLYMSPDKPFKTLLISSSGPQDGKSSSVISLGIAMAQTGNRVLLVDTDMRRPRLHKSFGVPNDVGVSSAIVGEGTLESAVKSTEVPGLFVLTCGPIPPNPAELLHTKAFSELLQKVTGKFDRVILDSPPIAAVADPLILSTQVDGVVLVVKAGRTTKEMVRRSVQSLRSVNAKLFGIILNNADFDRHSSYSGSSYAKGYGYYYQEKEDEA